MYNKVEYIFYKYLYDLALLDMVNIKFLNFHFQVNPANLSIIAHFKEDHLNSIILVIQKIIFQNINTKIILNIL